MSPESLYRRLPIWGQTLFIQAHAIGNAIRRRQSIDPDYLLELAARQMLRNEDLLKFRTSRLASHLQAAARTPFWSRRFREMEVNPFGSNPFQELGKLPILSKAEVQASGAKMVNPSVPPHKRRWVSTSGTTGSGLRFCETAEAENERWGIWWRYRSRIGITPSTPCAYFGARPVVPVDNSKPPYWRVNLPAKQLMFSAFHLGPNTFRDYVAALESQAAPWIHGFPTTLSLLAELMLAAGVRLRHKVEIVTIGAENLQPVQRERISKAFNCRVAQHYGLAESVANVSECTTGTLHIDEDFSHVELIALADDPGSCRIVGTNWSNPAFPLLRYDTGDLATPTEQVCACSLSWRAIQSIDGRHDDMLVLSSGARVGRLAMLFKNFPEIKESQIRQTRPGEFTFLVVPGAHYEANGVEKKLLALAYERLGQDSSINIRQVTAIERTRGGKIRLVVRDGPLIN